MSRHETRLDQELTRTSPTTIVKCSKMKHAIHGRRLDVFIAMLMQRFNRRCIQFDGSSTDFGDAPFNFGRCSQPPSVRTVWILPPFTSFQLSRKSRHLLAQSQEFLTCYICSRLILQIILLLDADASLYRSACSQL